MFTRVCKEFGRPPRLRTDHGGPFATNTVGRRAQLSAWWVRLGLRPECIEPGKPHQNGRHARRHRPLNADTTRPPGTHLRAQPQPFHRFRKACNHAPPHEALARRTPAVAYAPSPRKRPHQLPPLEAPDRFEVRYVSANGGIRWHQQGGNVAPVCVGAEVGLEDMDDGVWNVSCGPLNLGRRLARHLRIADASGSLTRRR